MPTKNLKGKTNQTETWPISDIDCVLGEQSPRKASRRLQRVIRVLCSFLFTYVKAKLQGAGVHGRGRGRGRAGLLRLLPIHRTESFTLCAHQTLIGSFFILC